MIPMIRNVNLSYQKTVIRPMSPTLPLQSSTYCIRRISLIPGLGLDRHANGVEILLNF